MKPTEADIQAEMIEGWEILNGFNFGTKQGAGGWVDIRHTKTPLKVTFYENFKKIEFSDGLDDSGATIDAVNFLTGNYDLSSISQHYDPEEWQRIITMCKSIVRLITGEQVEQTLEEKVREIKFHELEYEEITEECVNLVSGGLRYWIYSDKVGLQYLSDDSDRPSFRPIDEYCKTAFGFGEKFQAIAALLTEQPEQTLEEAVRGWLEDVDNDWFEIKPDHVLVHFSSRTDRIDCDHVSDGNCKWHVSTLDHSRYVANYVKAIRNIAAALSTRSTKPSYSDLEQRVEELEKYIASDYCKENCELREEIDSLNESYEQIAETKTRVLDALEATQAELKEKKSRITDLEAQLQDYISLADHEAEVQKWVAYCDSETKDHQKTRADLIKYRKWWESEYAKNAEASQ